MSIAKVNFCGSCEKKEVKRGEEMRKCSRCKLISYCNASCQSNDWEDHKEYCNGLKSMKMELAKIESKLVVYNFDQRKIVDLFQTHKGKFVTSFDEDELPQIYLEKKFEVASLLLEMSKNNFDVLTLVAKHLEKILELDHSDVFEAQDKLVFVYLLLGQDQDAYDFIKFWTLKDPEHETMERNQNRFEDFEDIEMLSLSFKAALLALKMGNLQTLDERENPEDLEKRFGNNLDDTNSAKITDVPLIMDCLRLFLTGNEKNKALKEEQKRQIQILLKAIHENSDTVLPLLINPEQDNFGDYQAEEIYQNSQDYFLRLDGAKTMIEKFLQNIE